MLVVALQNLVAYSVNMLDNIMLGSYSQNALSGAATVNQIFFIVNQLALSIGNALVGNPEADRNSTGTQYPDRCSGRDSLYVHAGAASGNIYNVT